MMEVLAVVAIMVGVYLLSFGVPLLIPMGLIVSGFLWLNRRRPNGQTYREWREEQAKEAVRAAGYVFVEDEERIAEILGERPPPRE